MLCTLLGRTVFTHRHTHTKHFGYFESSSNCELLPFQRCRNNENKDIFLCLLLSPPPPSPPLPLPPSTSFVECRPTSSRWHRHHRRHRCHCRYYYYSRRDASRGTTDIAKVRYMWQIKSHIRLSLLLSPENEMLCRHPFNMS